MKEYQSLSHTRWDCKYHIVFIPKKRKAQIYGALRRHLGEIFRELARQRGSEVVEGHLMKNHVHMCLAFRRSTLYRAWLALSKAKVP